MRKRTQPRDRIIATFVNIPLWISNVYPRQRRIQGCVELKASRCRSTTSNRSYSSASSSLTMVGPPKSDCPKSRSRPEPSLFNAPWSGWTLFLDSCPGSCSLPLQDPSLYLNILANFSCREDLLHTRERTLDSFRAMHQHQHGPDQLGSGSLSIYHHSP